MATSNSPPIYTSLTDVTHNAHRLQLKGDSLRKQKALKIAAA